MQVRPFLAGYYQCFIPNFSSLACPLTDLTKKGLPEKVYWTKETEKAFQSLKTTMTTQPVLHAPDFTLPFILQTDASDKGLRADFHFSVQHGAGKANANADGLSKMFVGWSGLVRDTPSYLKEQ